MKKTAKALLFFLMIVRLSYSQSAFPRQLTDTIWAVTESQIRNANLTADSLDEYKELYDSLQSQIFNGLAVIKIDSMVQQNLVSQIANRESLIGQKDIQLRDEKLISSAYRKKYRFWKVLSIVLGGLTVYQIVK